jgi:hypothetical protein
MPYHDWSEQDFDWKSLYSAIDEITDFMKRYGRIGVHSKEKYGTARWSLYFFTGHFHDLTHPGHVYSRYPQWLWVFDVRYRPLRFLQFPIQWYQSLITKIAFVKACKKYPHIIKEILSDAPEGILPPDLEVIRASMWITVGDDDQ